MKKKYIVSSKDKKDWTTFTKEMHNINAKEADLLEKNTTINKTKKLDLHGYSLDEANKIIKKFIIESFNSGCKKVLIVTGKGLRSKSYDNPYHSAKLSILKHSVPEYIKNNEILYSKINKITEAAPEEGGEGAINIFFKNNKKFIE